MTERDSCYNNDTVPGLRNPNQHISINENTEHITNMLLPSEVDLNLSCMDLKQTDFNRLRIFYESKLNQTFICRSTASVFISYDMNLIRYSVTSRKSNNIWRHEAQGAIILQLNFDPELPDEVCGAKVIISNPKTCDRFWSTSLHSWNSFESVDEHFYVFKKYVKGSDAHADEMEVFRDHAIGIYFGNIKAAKEFNGFVKEYIERVIIYEKRDSESKAEAIKQYNTAKILKKKTDPISKSTISSPVMFCHTMHMQK